ncbi:hypothetical protein HPB48_006893 [Haemaphysalis longicornis]|uniref:HTH CENPB-type domain-containing protein n=1 Tax=Haemaphysalis longicornis TaxID=44386 RepID=A0A9J6FEI1_HAELO|nr:hypothetical protein HPB48_006893 [Haemaphysalis longicornis]
MSIDCCRYVRYYFEVDADEAVSKRNGYLFGNHRLDVYAAQYSGDGEWYRCEVRKKLSNSTSLVEYIDYGNAEEVKHGPGLVKLAGELAKMPGKALFIRLDGLQSIRRDDDPVFYDKRRPIRRRSKPSQALTDGLLHTARRSALPALLLSLALFMHAREAAAVAVKEAITGAVARGMKGSRKKLRSPAFEAVEEALFKWFLDCKGVEFAQKAIDFRLYLGCDNFVASDGWLQRFKERRDIVGRVVTGESRSVDEETATAWVQANVGPVRVIDRLLLNMRLKRDTKIDVYMAMEMLHAAWMSVTASTIANCFRHAFAASESSCDSDESADRVGAADDTSASNEAVASWSALIDSGVVRGGETFCDYVRHGFRRCGHGGT